MKVSVIIVNYNVKFFLEQCLYSVYKALNGIDGEVIVVDNDSTDGSAELVRRNFPQVQLIENRENIGYSKANNLGIKVASGEYILILNPDTVIEENTLRLCLHFMDEHPDAGALGPKMIDGRGNYLPESKRGLPSPITAFYKISGINVLFPKSEKFNHYYLGHLEINTTQKVDVLTGAFFLTRKKILEDIGLLDETFFMYGEDIDLSYRIKKAGYNNYYFPETTIIHYKGESTKRGSINYVLLFYKAMKIFTNKHFKKQNAWWFSLLIDLAIYFRASLSIMRRISIKIFPLVLDASIFYAVLYLIANFWEEYKFHNSAYYSELVYYFIIPFYTVIWLLSLFLFNSYTPPFKVLNTVKGIITGSIIILVLYALLPESMRYSRALILLGSISTFFVAIISKFLLHLTGIKEYLLYSKKNKKIAIIGKYQEIERIEAILQRIGIKKEQVEYIYPDKNKLPEPFYYNLTTFYKLTGTNSISEIIFCASDIATEDIIRLMKTLTPSNIDFKIATPGSNTVVGSNSPKSSGDIYTIKLNS